MARGVGRTWLVLLGLFGAARIAASAPDHTGVSSHPHPVRTEAQVANIPARVLWYRLGLGDETVRFAGYGLQITFVNSQAALNAANLANYDLLIISQACPGQLTTQRTRIANFVAAGRALLIHQLDCPGTMDFMPDGFGIKIRDYYWCGFPNSFRAHLVGTAHPIVSGLTDSDLAGTFDWVESLGPGFTVLAVNPDAACGDPGLAAGLYGSGRIAFEDGNASSNSIWRGSDAYWINLLTWLYVGSVVPVRHSSWGELKTHYR